MVEYKNDSNFQELESSIKIKQEICDDESEKNVESDTEINVKYCKNENVDENIEIKEEFNDEVVFENQAEGEINIKVEVKDVLIGKNKIEQLKNNPDEDPLSTKGSKNTSCEMKFYTCTYCAQTFTTLFELTEHFSKIHTNKEFKCTNCEYSSDCSRNVSVHMSVKHEHDDFSCKICGKIFKGGFKVAVFKQHIKLMQGKYKCEFLNCEKAFCDKRSRDNHIAFEHKMAKKYKCSDCGKIFQTNYKLERHAKTHLGYYQKRYNFNCPKCGLNTKDDQEFRDHMRVVHPILN